MKKFIGKTFGLVVAFTAGIIVATYFTSSDLAYAGEAADKMADKKTTEPPAYMIISGKPPQDPEKLKPYADVAGPLARAAGMEFLATADGVVLLEGEWPYEGGVYVEKYTSMSALKEFWYSGAYQEAKKLREGLVDIDFIIAVEGVGAEH